MDPIKKLQAQISALRAKGNKLTPNDKTKLAELEAKLALALNPQGAKPDADKGLVVEKTEKKEPPAPKNFDDEIAEDEESMKQSREARAKETPEERKAREAELRKKQIYQE